MKAVIMAGGSGTRLRPLTCGCPKPMMPLLNKPVMEYSIEFLKQCGIDSIAVTTQYLPQKIKDYFQSGQSFGVSLNYFFEEKPLGTAGSVKNAQDFLDETFVVISGDALIKFDYEEAIKFHKKNNALVTIVLSRVSKPIEYGVVINDSTGRITRFLEKPNWREVFSDTVNTGVYIIEPEILNYIQKNEKTDFSQDVFPKLMGKGIYGYVSNDYWCDIGSLPVYRNAHEDIFNGLTGYKPNGKEIRKDIFVGNNVELGDNVILNPPCFIGDNTIIEDNSVIGPYTSIGNNNKIGTNVNIKKAIIWNNNKIENNSIFIGTVLGSDCFIENNVQLNENTVIGDSCHIGANAMITNGSKIWPEKRIHRESKINKNVLWQTREKKSFFGKKGIEGNIQKDMSAEYLLKLGMSIGAYMPKGGTIAIGFGNKQTESAIINTFINGFALVGVNVLKVGQVTVPVLWTACEFLNPNGAVYISLENQSLQIRVYDSAYVELDSGSERKIENILYTCKYQERMGDKEGEIIEYKEATRFYINKFKRSIEKNQSVSNNNKIKIAMYSPNNQIERISNQILQDCDYIEMRWGDRLNATKANKSWEFYIEINENGEKISLYDNTNQKIGSRQTMELASKILQHMGYKDKFIIPYEIPETLQNNIVSDWGDNVLYSKSTLKEMMRKAAKEFSNRILLELDMFDILFDPLAFTIALCRYLHETKINLKQLLSKTTQYYIKEESLDFPIEKRGRVLRKIIDEATEKGRSIELVEGVKIRNNRGYTLITQANNSEQFRIISEGFSQEVADELTALYKGKMENIKNSK